MTIRRVIPGVLAVVCVTVILFLNGELRRATGPQWHRESLTYLPGGERLKPVFLGFETTVAHYLWIRTIIYFGGHAMSDKEYPRLINMVDVITRLCPWFYPAYEFAGVMLPDVCNNPEAARILLERGLTTIGDRKWNVAFTMGVIYLRYYNDRKTAAHYIARAAMVPNAPREKLTAMANTFYRQAGYENEGLLFLLFSYENADNPEVRRYLAEQIESLYPEYVKKFQ